MQKVIANPFQRGSLSYGLLLLHLLVIIYVLIGWMSDSRIALLLYQLALPALALQWLFNRDSSLLSNSESLLRANHWRDPRNAGEGRVLHDLIENMSGLRVRPAEIVTVVYSLMSLFWVVAMLRMVMIIAPVPLIRG